MRVISGALRGRELKAVPGKGTRPSTDKVKEAIFSRIGPYFEGGTVLDLFAGTGGLGIEALSRGMEQCIFVDKDRKSIEVIRENIKLTRLTDQSEIYRNDAFRALKILSHRNIQFELVFIDPPYNKKISENILIFLDENRLLKEEATIVVEHESNDDLAEVIGRIHLDKQNVYGNTTISVYKYN